VKIHIVYFWLQSGSGVVVGGNLSEEKEKHWDRSHPPLNHFTNSQKNRYSECRGRQAIVRL
jgi:hypothetical protein